MIRYVLASGSPRRKELLGQMGIQFEISAAHGEEIITKEYPSDIVEELSCQKACEVAQQYNDKYKNDTTVIIGADTIVACDDEIMGKPRDKDDAVRMLTMISARKHQVYTGVTLVIIKNGEKKIVTFHEKTDVYVYSMTKEQIEDYVETCNPIDKAGAYGIQEVFGIKHIQKIDGDYNNVVGLPASRLYQELIKLKLA